MERAAGTVRFNWIGWLVAGVVATAIYAFQDSEWGKKLDLASMNLRFWGFVAFAAFVGAAVLWVWLTTDSTVTAALKMGDAGKVADGLKLANQAIRDKGKTGQRLDGIGQLHVMNGQFEEAIACFREATTLEGPKTGRGDQFRLREADALAKVGRPGEAIPLIDECLNRDETNFKARAQRAQCLIGLDRLEAALAEIAVLRKQYRDTQFFGSPGNKGWKACLEECEQQLSKAKASSPL